MTSGPREAMVRTRSTYDAWHFAEATRVGDLVWVSGQPDAEDRISADPDEQARMALRNLGEVLHLAGAEFADIVELTTYHTDMADVDGFLAVKDEVIHPPYRRGR